MNNSNASKPRPNAFADRITGLDDPSMGDERERDVILRAYTFGSVVSTHVFFALAVLFAVIGAGLWTIPLVLGTGVAGLAVPAYCKREGVDFTLAVSRAANKRIVVSYAVSAVFTAAWVAAIAFQQTTGHPLIDVGLGSPLAGASNGSFVTGAIIGIVIALTAFAVLRHRKLKRARLEEESAADIEDEE
ncbi:hypothetical protein [Brevibacterium sp. FME37]|uniref:hypothetical protein n=1 Tax=Brevibacterium sp. FME37 TaxID=2742607 RepID=UPI00186635CB|nr:hypothetical protein [Brevibacterium sp. FME37]